MGRTEVSRSPRRLLHPGLVASGSTLLIGTCVSDFLYWQTLLFQWNNVSEWLLAAGLCIAALATVAFIVDLLFKRAGTIDWVRFTGITIAALLSLLNAFVHSRDSYTAVVPEGIILSAVVAGLLIILGVGGGWCLLRRDMSSPPLQTGDVGT